MVSYVSFDYTIFQASLINGWARMNWKSCKSIIYNKKIQYLIDLIKSQEQND